MAAKGLGSGLEEWGLLRVTHPCLDWTGNLSEHPSCRGSGGGAVAQVWQGSPPHPPPQSYRPSPCTCETGPLGPPQHYDISEC